MSRNPFKHFLQDTSTSTDQSSSSSNPNADSSIPSSSASISSNVASSAPPATTLSNTSVSARPSTANTTTSSSTTPTPAPPSDNSNINLTSPADDPLNEELPPAYTPGPDVYQGEQTVEYGPTRPFQQPPPRPVPQPPPPPQHPQLVPHPTGIQSQPSGLGPGSGWSTVQSHVHSQPQSLWRQITDALTDRLDNLSVAGPSGNTHYGYGYNNSYPPQPYGPGPNAYPPPSGPPPSSPSSSIPDDGRPTNKPVPGHPLLNEGKLLVYPAGYSCEKCHNTGYKHADPTHPCRKCWSKYAKPYKGALTYVWGPSNNSSSNSDNPSSPISPSSSHTSPHSHSTSNFQRPLPKMRPPNAGYSAPPPLRPNPTGGSGYPGASWHGHHPPPSGPPPGPPVAPMNTGGTFAPPPGPPPAPAITPTPTGALNSAQPTSPQQTYSPPPGPPGTFSPPPGPPPPPHGMYHPPPGPPPLPHGAPPLPPRPNIQIVPAHSSYSPYGSQNRPPPGGVVYRPGDPRIGGRPCWRCGGDGRSPGLGGLFFDEGCGVCNGIGRVF
ncbi:hypothetical protein K435DRAFT_848702 [Dendrothele bispora CBS 962.96]|uniref:Uncharacterized protein n=1 Tax=Dendrothele bispora (strain CBS 962.96) TaxID=1314807 RepID=A0A4S8MV90_DENBC|nr:hypothetical protein K435DRAFT_848702 [Dendrothele bispora CBS 962.96]